MEESEHNGKAIGGYARAQSLSAEERKRIATAAAKERWSGNIPVALREGEFTILDSGRIAAAVLANGQRLLTQATFLRALGRSRSPKAGTGVLSTVDGTPFFLQAETLKPFIDDELMKSTAPVFFRTQQGKKSVGYDARLLPQVCNVYLKMRDDYTQKGKQIPQQYEHIIVACDMLVRGLATVGIVALVDEATGYQEVRDKQALQAILDAYLRKEFAAYAKRFPDEFYFHIFRLHGWQWKGRKGRNTNPPQVVAYYTKDIVYARLAPAILDELEKRNPIEDGRRKHKHHQLLTDDIGHPALAQHLHAIITLQRVSTSWKQFMDMLDVAHPRRGDTIMFSFMTENLGPASYLPDDVPSATLQLSSQSLGGEQETKIAP